ncbi:MAG TPA: ComEC/Rec2 family competence protein [Gaiellaceae bacterium]|nr:ComEC/Rec2 family competence protein [Gaiellaceae bacterium]
MRLRTPYLLAGALCAGLAAATAARVAPLPSALVGAALLAAAVAAERPQARIVALALLLAVGGWAWGSRRLDRIDRSVLAPRIGTAERALVQVEEPPRRGSFELRMRVLVLRWGDLRPHEPALLELPLGRAPPQGARLSVLGRLHEPRGPSDGFDERTWLRRHGMHVVLKADAWRAVGRRGGLGGLADRLHGWLARDGVPGLAGERRAVLEGVLLGEEQGLSDGLRQDFRASGLYHLLAVSDGNVAVVVGGTVWLAFLLGVPWLAAQLAGLAAIGGYVLAVGPQPSVVRAGIAGALASFAWLSGRERDARHALLVAAVVLLAWSPYNLLDPGFQLSFAAVLAIFTAARPLARRLEGYPLPARLREPVALSAVCGVATAPISWLQFHQIPLLTVPANAAAAPVVAPLLALALLCAVLNPFVPPLAALLAWANGWCAAYLVACARFFGSVPGAQIRSPLAAAALALGAAGLGAYAWRRGRRDRAESRLPDRRERQAEDRAGAAAAP